MSAACLHFASRLKTYFCIGYSLKIHELILLEEISAMIFYPLYAILRKKSSGWRRRLWSRGISCAVRRLKNRENYDSSTECYNYVKGAKEVKKEMYYLD